MTVTQMTRLCIEAGEDPEVLEFCVACGCAPCVRDEDEFAGYEPDECLCCCCTGECSIDWDDPVLSMEAAFAAIEDDRAAVAYEEALLLEDTLDAEVEACWLAVAA